jgi:hypothetical protein
MISGSLPPLAGHATATSRLGPYTYSVRGRDAHGHEVTLGSFTDNEKAISFKVKQILNRGTLGSYITPNKALAFNKAHVVIQTVHRFQRFLKDDELKTIGSIVLPNIDARYPTAKGYADAELIGQLEWEYVDYNLVAIKRPNKWYCTMEVVAELNKLTPHNGHIIWETNFGDLEADVSKEMLAC